MFQRCPEIHPISSNLKFYTHRCFTLSKKYRNLNNHVIASIAIWFGIFYIILYFNNFDIILLCDQIRYHINIINKCTNYSNTCYII